MNDKTLGIIGGSGLYELDGLQDKAEIDVDTPYGKPSDVIVTGRLHGVRCAFLPRHGRGHRLAARALRGAPVHHLDPRSLPDAAGSRATLPRGQRRAPLLEFGARLRRGARSLHR